MSRWAPKWRDATHDACYRALEAAEADRDRLETEVRTQDTLIQRWMTTAEDEKARADRLAGRVAGLERDQGYYVDELSEARRRVAELEQERSALARQLSRAHEDEAIERERAENAVRDHHRRLAAIGGGPCVCDICALVGGSDVQ